LQAFKKRGLWKTPEIGQGKVLKGWEGTLFQEARERGWREHEEFFSKKISVLQK
jgi:hypothetical protein